MHLFLVMIRERIVQLREKFFAPSITTTMAAEKDDLSTVVPVTPRFVLFKDVRLPRKYNINE